MELNDIKMAVDAHSEATQTSISALRDEITGINNNILQIEQRSGGFDPGYLTPNDLADTLTKHDLVQSLATKSRRDGGVIEVKASDLLETKSTVTDNGGNFHNVSGSPSGIFAGLERRRFIYDFLPNVGVSTGHVAVTREFSYSNNAAVTVAGSPAVYTEGIEKAESDIVFETIDLRLPVIAHWLKVSNQALADVGQLRSVLEHRLRYGLRTKQDAEIVSTLQTSGNYIAFTPTTGDDGIASVNRALALLETNDAVATLICLNPTTWRGIQRIRSVAGDGQHIVGNPQQVTGEMLWGVPVLPTNAVSPNELLVLDTVTLGEYFTRQTATIDFGFVNDDFTKNLVTVRAELRGALQVVRGVSVAYGSLTV